jgi:hypothetical protein
MSISVTLKNIPATPTTKHASLAAIDPDSFESSGPTGDKGTGGNLRSGTNWALTGSDPKGSRMRLLASTSSTPKYDGVGNPLVNHTSDLLLTAEVLRVDSVTGARTVFPIQVQIVVKLPLQVEELTVPDVRRVVEAAAAQLIGPFDGTTGVGEAVLLRHLLFNNTNALE